MLCLEKKRNGVSWLFRFCARHFEIQEGGRSSDCSSSSNMGSCSRGGSSRLLVVVVILALIVNV